MRENNDFNFFSRSIAASRKTRNRGLFILLCVVIFAGIIGGLYYMANKEVMEMEEEIDGQREYITSPEVAAKLEEIKVKKNELTVLMNYYDAIDAVSIDIDKADVIGSELLVMINLTLPQDVTFRNAIYSPGYISFNAVSDSRISIAELYHNLVVLDLFSEVNIGTIAENELYDGETLEKIEYTVDIQCVMKGGVTQ